MLEAKKKCKSVILYPGLQKKIVLLKLTIRDDRFFDIADITDTQII